MKQIQWKSGPGKRKLSKNYLMTCDWSQGWRWRVEDSEGCCFVITIDTTFVISEL